MADIFSDGAPGRRALAQGSTNSLPTEASRKPGNVDPIACVELFYFAYREFTSDPDTILAQYAFGRAHHRVLHFVHRNPGLKVAELLEILKITKQSLARVLKQLVDEGFVIQRAGNEDRRERRLYLSAKGARLTDKLTQIQVRRIENALAKLGPESSAIVSSFLFLMIAETDRPQVENLIRRARPQATANGSDSNE
jgi:DNA-binding MarR family transcriptional regulator